MQGTIDFSGSLAGSIADGGGTNVVANPSGTATDELEKIQVDDTIYSIPTGTEVEANPSGSATDELEKIDIDGTIYGIPTAKINYSTDEQEIGKWIDGSPLYQRTWFFSSPVSVNQNAWGDTPILVSETNINLIVECHSLSSNGFNQAIGATTDGGTTTYVRIFNVRTNSAIAVSYLTLKYTKTTI